MSRDLVSVRIAYDSVSQAFEVYEPHSKEPLRVSVEIVREMLSVMARDQRAELLAYFDAARLRR